MSLLNIIDRFNQLKAEHWAIIHRIEVLAIRENCEIDLNDVYAIQSDCKDHYMREEDLMIEVEYPYVHTHILAHTIEGKSFLRLSINPEKYSIYSLLCDVYEHMNTYDKQFAAYIVSRSS